jgi:anti-sigma factor RsiW
MNCQELEPWLSAYEDGELDPRRRRMVEAHLSCCPDCRALSHGWADLARDVRVSLARREAPEGLHGRVMRQIPEPAAGLLTRRSPGTSWRWLSVALAPAAAAAVWLLWGLHPVARTLLPTFRPSPISAASPLEATNRFPTLDGAIQLALPAEPSVLHLVKSPSPTASPRERAKRASTRPALAPAGSVTHAGKTQGRRPPEGDAMRRLRRLRPARVRHRLAEYRPWGRRRPHQARQWQLLAKRPSPPLGPAVDIRAGLPRIDVVEYVLPALQPAQPAPVLEAGLNL